MRATSSSTVGVTMDVKGLRIRQLSELQQLLQQYPPFRQIELRQYWQRQIEEATANDGLSATGRNFPNMLSVTM